MSPENVPPLKYMKQFLVANVDFLNNNKKFDFTAKFQRTPVWTISQKQLFIDSLLRDIDVPKFYFRVLENGTYQVIDGKQRLMTIFDFIKGRFKLSVDSDEVEGKNIAGLPFDELDIVLQMIFNNRGLDVVLLHNYDDDYIEEMFLRLQNGTPLNAPEKRRAIGGNMRDVVESLSHHNIFNPDNPDLSLCSFKNRRFAYEDAVAKILHIVLNGSITDIRPESIKKTYLANKHITESDSNVKKVKKAFNFMSQSFKETSEFGFFKKHSIITLTYITIHLLNNYNINYYKEEFAKAYLDFELNRNQNEELDEAEQDGELAAYTDAARSDSVANMKYRYDLLLRNIVESIPDLALKDLKRDFTEEQRTAIFHRDKGICQICGKKCDENEYHADHKKPYSKSGKTKISNGQLLCPSCNREKSDS